MVSRSPVLCSNPACIAVRALLDSRCLVVHTARNRDDEQIRYS
jgi:hypothetical protein